MKWPNLTLVLFVSIFLLSSPANARQDDPRLDELFSALSETDNYNEGKVIERSIWTIWLTSGSDTIDFLMAQGMNYMSQGALAKSLTLFTSIIKIDPEYSEAWNKRATVLFLMGEFDASVEDIGRTLELEPRHFGALSGLGQIFDRQDIDAGAISAYQKAVALNPHMPGVKERMKQLKKEQDDKKI
ncbi:MAG: tetratricopeptide repeat protein [Sneathiella sp.]